MYDNQNHLILNTSGLNKCFRIKILIYSLATKENLNQACTF